jgi:hypothetical protein
MKESAVDKMKVQAVGERRVRGNEVSGRESCVMHEGRKDCSGKAGG